MQVRSGIEEEASGRGYLGVIGPCLHSSIVQQILTFSRLPQSHYNFILINHSLKRLCNYSHFFFASEAKN